MVTFKIQDEDWEPLSKVLDRAAAIAVEHGREFHREQFSMSLVAAHANGCPLDLARLLSAPVLDFCHDVWGIHRHIDTETGSLGIFHPRCAAQQ